MLPHDGQYGAADAMDAKKIRVELRHCFLRVCLLHGASDPVSGTVDDYVNSPVAVLNLLYTITDGSFVGHVHAQRVKLRAIAFPAQRNIARG